MQDGPAHAISALSDQQSPFSFVSVEEFLDKVKSAKDNQRPAISDYVNECVSRKDTVGVPPDIADRIMELVGEYGDEALRQLGLFCLGKWVALHMGIAEEAMKQQEVPVALASSMDIARLTSAISLAQDIRSYSGNEKWAKMLSQAITNAVNDALNQQEHS